MSGELVVKTIQTGAVDDPLIIGNDVSISGNIDAANIASTVNINDLVDHINLLEQRMQLLESCKQIVNFTKHVNPVREDITASSIFKLDEFEVEKKSPTSTLFVQGTISGWGAQSGSMMQHWKYGDAEFVGQSLSYGSHSRIYPATAVLERPGFTGTDLLELWYFTNNGCAGELPFSYYNPNSGVDARLGQTKSVYFVWEIDM